MFKNFKFSILEFGVELAPKRTKILHDIIVKNEGTFISKQDISLTNLPDYIITTKTIKLTNIKEMLKLQHTTNSELFNEITDRLYSPDFITNSLKIKEKVQDKNYKIELSSSASVAAIKRTNNNIMFEECLAKRKFPFNREDVLKEEIKRSEINSDCDNKENEIEVNTITITTSTSINNFNENNKNNNIMTNVAIIKSINQSETKFSHSQNQSLKGLDGPDKKENKITSQSQSELLINSTIENTTEEPVSSFPDVKLMTIKTTPETKTLNNKQLFEEIQKNIISLRNQGKFEKKNCLKNEEEEEEVLEENDYDYDYDYDSQSLISTYSNSITPSQAISSKTFSSSNNINNATSTYKPDPSKFAFNLNPNQSNLNEHITTELEKVLEFHQSENNVFESLAYRKAISVLKNAKEKISSCDQLKKYKNLGKSIGSKVKEIILTGRLKKGDFLSNDERSKTLKILTSVWGVGKSLAETLFRKGMKTIEDLRANQNLLTQNQKIGLKYYEELAMRIPREEMEQIFKFVKEEVFKILPDIIQVEMCGSYRRGKKLCGDIDIIITRKDDGGVEGILQSLIASLMKTDIITDILTLGESSFGLNKYQFMGICKYLNNPHRRIDIKVYKKEHYPFALLYFTGSAYFNRSMRLFASKVGFHLSDHHLKEIKSALCIKCDTEEDIFTSLGIDYKSPSQREI